MDALSSQEIARIWETGLGQHSLDRALTILAAAFPHKPREQLAKLSVGQRDECLFALRERTFGPRLASLVVCPGCQEELELVLDTADLGIVPEADPVAQIQTAQQVTGDGYEISFRLPDSLDLAAVVACCDVADARSLLVQRCVLHASSHDVGVAVEDLPATALAALASQLDACDPLAALDIAIDCTACGQHWQILFDIVSFFWAEIVTHAKRLLREVHILAQAYGWCEADILSLSTARRQFYLEMVT